MTLYETGSQSEILSQLLRTPRYKNMLLEKGSNAQVAYNEAETPKVHDLQVNTVPVRNCSTERVSQHQSMRSNSQGSHK